MEPEPDKKTAPASPINPGSGNPEKEGQLRNTGSNLFFILLVLRDRERAGCSWRA